MLLGGLGVDVLIGDCNSPTNASGGGGNDLLDMGADGGLFAIGDHNIFDPSGGGATGAGNDRIIGGTGNDILVGDSSVLNATVTTAANDVLTGRDGNDTLFGDNADFDLTMTVGTAGGSDSLQGGNGADTLKAGPGMDALNGGNGSPDTCDGEAGSDSAASCEIIASVP